MEEGAEGWYETHMDNGNALEVDSLEADMQLEKQNKNMNLKFWF